MDRGLRNATRKVGLLSVVGECVEGDVAKSRAVVEVEGRQVRGCQGRELGEDQIVVMAGLEKATEQRQWRKY